jgi:polyferredoxin
MPDSASLIGFIVVAAIVIPFLLVAVERRYDRVKSQSAAAIAIITVFILAIALLAFGGVEAFK